MKTLIAITNPELKELFFDPTVLAKLEAVSEVDWAPPDKPFTSEELASVIRDYDAVLTSWGSPRLTGPVVEQADKLKFVGHVAGSVAGIASEAVYDAGIVVTSANKPMGRSTAEGAVAYMLAGAWQLRRYSERLRQGQWSAVSRNRVPGLTNRTVGLIGNGEISRLVMKLIRPFQPRILVYCPFTSQEQAAELGVELCGLEELMRASDIVSVHCTWTPETTKMIGAAQLRQMKDGALLVNTARGAIIDEAALIEELKTGRIEAVLDVYEQEPLPADNPLLALPNVLCMPHMAGTHDRLISGMGGYVVDDLIRFLQGQEPDGVITRERFRIQSPR